jgi:hypothetical protein
MLSLRVLPVTGDPSIKPFRYSSFDIARVYIYIGDLEKSSTDWQALPVLGLPG